MSNSTKSKPEIVLKSFSDLSMVRLAEQSKMAQQVSKGFSRVRNPTLEGRYPSR